jgi:hypothetical protein
MSNNLYTYQKNVTTSGTPVQLQSQAVEPDQVVLIKAKVANTGIISVGYSSATALNSSTAHFKLRAGESVTIKVPEASLIWIDSTVNGEGVEFAVGAFDGTVGSSGGALQSAGADAESNTASAQVVSARASGFNGTTWDRLRAGLSGVKTAITGFLNNVPYAQYLSSAVTLANNEWHHLVSTVNGFLKVSLGDLIGGEDLTNNVMGTIAKPLAASTYSPSVYTELTQVTKANIKASTGNVLSFDITNDNAAVRYFQLHNKATAPAATEVPLYSFKVPAGTATAPGRLTLGREFWTEAGKNFPTGIGWAISTTYGTFTDSATNTEHILNLHYV